MPPAQEQPVAMVTEHAPRVLIALGGNAMTDPLGSATPDAQRRAIEIAMGHVADLIGGGAEVVLTHGNGPQVGNLLVKNEMAADVVPPVPLDWCVAQTQATVGLLVLDALESELARRRLDRHVATVVTRTLVDPSDPAFDRPTKPIGRFLPAVEAERFVAAGQNWADLGSRGWRRVVASPEPTEVLDAPTAAHLASAGYVVVAGGGGGIPVVRDADGTLRGVEAVLDKDLTAVVLARAVDADVLVIATDVDAAVAGYGTSDARPIGRITPTGLRALAADGHFAAGSMAPKVEAAVRFVEQGGRRAVITSLARIADAVKGAAGTVVET